MQEVKGQEKGQEKAQKDRMPKVTGSWGSGPEAPQPAPSETPVNQNAADEAAKSVKPSAPGETGTTPGTNWR